MLNNLFRGRNYKTIKGNINSKNQKIFHVPSGRLYDRVNATELFSTEEEAELAGYRKSKI